MVKKKRATLDIESCDLQAQFKGGAQSIEEISIAGVSSLKKLESWLKQNEDALEFAKKEVDEINQQINAFENRRSHLRRMVRLATKQKSKLKRKVENLRKVKGEKWELNTWYKAPTHWRSRGNQRFMYPTKSSD